MTTTTTRTPSAAPATGRFRRLAHRTDRRLGARDEHWAKGPAVVSLLALPALLWYAFGDGFLIFDDGPLAAVLFAGALALSVAWLLPHRESMRSARLTFAVTAVTLIVLPVVLTVVTVVVVVFGFALASGPA
ncbi:hypothetical protein [Streptomyces mobaraensis]|uniref:Uncharacterized protein n=1 Tax=Streptomyces mobaraensis TaxID=35621 RepID=A0A5N5WHP4_STRMB|nr:hypothetical protein [Streptomyces mobaraensis]KAB7852671.1 hypothetical protein FRZ00_00185 [Streptomyces mobaraensis]